MDELPYIKWSFLAHHRGLWWMAEKNNKRKSLLFVSWWRRLGLLGRHSCEAVAICYTIEKLQCRRRVHLRMIMFFQSKSNGYSAMICSASLMAFFYVTCTACDRINHPQSHSKWWRPSVLIDPLDIQYNCLLLLRLAHFSECKLNIGRKIRFRIYLQFNGDQRLIGISPKWGRHLVQ